MSRLPDLGKKFDNLSSILAEYESELEEGRRRVDLKGRQLAHANRENPAWFSYYDERRIELHTIVKWLETNVKRVRGKMFRGFTENSQQDLSDRAKDKYIDNEKAYLDAYELYLEAKETYDMYESLVEAFKQRGYALNNITKLRVAQLEDAVI